MLDFDAIGKYRENNRIEAKKAVGGFPHSLWETYSAFANTIGGVILLGVVEGPDKTFHPVRLPDPQWLVDEFWAGAEDPAVVSANILAPSDVWVQTVDQLPVVVIRVPRADRRQKPVYVGEDPYSGTYRRLGEGDYRCAAEEVQRMLRERQAEERDSRLLPGLGPDALCPASLKRYRARLAGRRPGSAWAELEDRDFLIQLGALGWDAAGGLLVSAAGLLLLGKRTAICQAFPQYHLQYEEKDAAGRISWRLDSREGDWSANLFDFYLLARERLGRSLSQAPAAVGQALEEALANAIIHADYEGGSGVTIQNLPPALTITNSGGMRLAPGEAFQRGAADPRNQRLAGMFHLVGVGQGQGGGLARIRTAWADQGWLAPVLAEEFGPDRTVLSLAFQRADKRRQARERQEDQLLEYITTRIVVSAGEAAEALGVSRPRAAAILSRLAEKGLLSEEKAAGGMRYRLKA